MSRVYQYDNRVDVTYVYDVEEVVKVRTGQTGLEAMQNFDSI